MEVKVCGVCRPVDAAAAAAAGANYVGVILGAPSARRRSVQEAAAIYDAAGGVQRAGVFADSPMKEVIAAATALRLDVIQLHGGETAEYVESVRVAGRWSVWKAARPRAAEELVRAGDAFGASADGLLIDGWNAVALGGTGTRAPWSSLRAERARLPRALRLILAGGLTAENVADAIEALRPDVVDVSSGVESAMGEKSAEAMRSFIASARAPRAPGVGV